jgi:hypothetical protein
LQSCLPELSFSYVHSCPPPAKSRLHLRASAQSIRFPDLDTRPDLAR